MLSLTDLEALRQKYQNIVSEQKKLEGEESQLALEKERLTAELSALGFANKAELDTQLVVLETEINALKMELETILR